MCGSYELYIFKIKSSNPLNTDKTKIIAAVPTDTLIKETKDTICTRFDVLFFKKYRLAIKNEKIIFYFFKSRSISSAYEAELSKKKLSSGMIRSWLLKLFPKIFLNNLEFCFINFKYRSVLVSGKKLMYTFAFAKS